MIAVFGPCDSAGKRSFHSTLATIDKDECARAYLRHACGVHACDTRTREECARRLAAVQISRSSVRNCLRRRRERLRDQPALRPAHEVRYTSKYTSDRLVGGSGTTSCST
jgi:hypothetical protein